MSETTRARRAFKPGDRLTRQEAAAYLGISVSRLAQHRRAGLIKHLKNKRTRAVHYLFEDVEQLKVWRSEQVDYTA